MRSAPEPQAFDDAPLYIRWSPDRSPYAIELKLDLVSKVTQELARAEKSAGEIGGVLVGSFPDALTPTVRIDDVEFLPREESQTGIFLLNPKQQVLYSEVRWRPKPRATVALGLFRSHLRSVPLRPSAADRNLLSTEFKQAIYAELLVEAKPPYTGALFLSTEGLLPEEPAVREFRLNEADFRALPEVQPEALPGEQEEASPPGEKTRLYAILGTLLLVGISACLLMWSFAKQSAAPQWLSSSHQLELAITGSRLLRISWNHAARELDGSSGATLVIADGAARSEIKLGLDELRLGAVEYDRRSPHVQVTMTVAMPGSTSVSQSAAWDQRAGDQR